MNRYRLTFDKTNSVFIVSYKNGQFARLDYKSGGLSESHFKYLTQVIPPKEDDINKVMEDYENRVKYEKLSNDVDSVFAKCMNSYCHFYESQTDLKPRIDGIEGAALKKIINHINTLTSSEEESVLTWSQLLSNWNKQDDFYRKQLLLRQINSNLPILLNKVKQHATGKTQANRDADDARKSL